MLNMWDGIEKTFKQIIKIWLKVNRCFSIKCNADISIWNYEHK